MKVLTPVDYWRAGFQAMCSVAEMQGTYARSVMGMMTPWMVGKVERDLFEKQAVAQPAADPANVAEPPRRARRHATPV